jgi:hypothetical protein
MEAPNPTKTATSFFSPVDQAQAQKLDIAGLWPSGIFRRKIELMSAKNACRARLQDDFHHFAVTLQHDGQIIRALTGEAIRIPWTACSGSLDMLHRLEGQPLAALAARIGAAERAQHCNHLFDLALLACDQTVRFENGQNANRRYDIDIAMDANRRGHLRCKRDGQVIVYVTLEFTDTWQSRVTSTGALQGRNLGSTKDLQLDTWCPQDREVLYVMRRAAHVSIGRWINIAENDVPSDYDVPPTCYTYQPERVSTAQRITGSIKDFTHTPEEL